MTLPGAQVAPLASLPADDDGRGPLASWRRRVLAAVLDQLLLAGATWLALGDEGSAPSLQVLPWDDRTDAVSWTHSGWLVLAVVALVALQGWTGYTPGKLVVGIAVVDDRDLRPAGVVRTALRVVAHVLDGILLIGFLRPLWHRERRTFADSIMGTLVLRRRPRSMGVGPARALTAGALVVCLAGAGFGVSWWGWDSGWDSGRVPCVPQAAAGADGDVAARAAVDLLAVGDRAGTHRLWMSQTTDVAREYLATWHWDPATTPEGDLTLALTATSPSGARTSASMGIADRSTAVTTTSATPDGDGRVSAQVSLDGYRPRDLGDVVDLTTSLLVDGRPVATCTAVGFRLTPPAEG
ncbi:MAG: RDD family protein [Promicromonosporaceae bacterium]|nr:RDD family protein [Promicromonosporaceae bacterium]